MLSHVTLGKFLKGKSYVLCNSIPAITQCSANKGTKNKTKEHHQYHIPHHSPKIPTLLNK